MRGTHCLLGAVIGALALLVGASAVSPAAAKVAKESAERAVMTLKSAASSGDFTTRSLAIDGMGAAAKKAVLPLVKEALEDPQWQVRRAAISALLGLGDKSWEEALLRAMGNEALDAATEVLPLLAPLGEKKTLALLKKGLSDPKLPRPGRYVDALADAGGSLMVKAWEMGLGLKKSPAVQAAFAAKLAELRLPDAVPLYQKVLKKQPPAVQAHVLDRILEDRRVQDIAFLTPLLASPDAQVVFKLSAALAMRGDAQGSAVLVAAVDEGEREAQLVALRALRHVTADVFEDVKDKLKYIAYDDKSDVELLRAAYEVYAAADYKKLAPHLEKRLHSTEIERRAAAVRVLGKVKGRAALEALHPLLRDGSALIRREAAGAIADIAQPESVQPLGDALYGERDLGVRVALIQALAAVRTPDVVPLLQQYIYDGDDAVRGAAVAALVAVRHQSAVELLKLKLTDRSEAVRRIVLAGLLDMGPGRHLVEFDRALPWVDSESLAALVAKHGEAMVPHLELALASERPELRYAALAALGTLGAQTRASIYAKLALKGERPALRVAGIEGMVASDGAMATEPLVQLARDKDMEVQVAAVLALGELRAVAQEALLMELTDSTTERVRVAAAWSLLRL